MMGYLLVQTYHIFSFLPHYSSIKHFPILNKFPETTTVVEDFAPKIENTNKSNYEHV